MSLLRWFFREFSRAVGYNDITDMIASMFLIKSYAINSFVFSVSMIGSLCLFFETYIYNPLPGLMIFLVTSIGETFYGTVANIKINGEKFDINKALRVVPKILSHIFFLSLAWNMGQVELTLSWLAPAVFIYFTTMNFLKAVRSAGKLKYVTGSFVEFIEEKFADNK
jgi:hypothetical protein